MGWFDIFSSVEDMIDDSLYYIKYKLADWVEMIAFQAIKFYETATGVGKTIWSDLELWLDQRIDDFLPDVLSRITSARNLAQYLHDTLKIELEEKIEAASGLPEQVITFVMSKLEPKIVSARQYAEYLTDTLQIEINRQIKTSNEYAKRLQTDVLGDLDKRIGVVMAAIANMDEVAGEARVRFYIRLKGIIDDVEQEAKDNLAEIYNHLKNHIALLEKASKDARGVLENALNTTIDVLEHEAKQAREVLEGTLIQIIEGVEDALEIAITDLERTFRGLLNVLIDRVDILESWIDNFAAIFDKELNKYQNRVVSWIVDGFEGILDRVFK
jgi:F0F1-type ATP synthase membrane subunit b/b'